MSEKPSPISRLIARLRFSQLLLLVHVNTTGSLRAAATVVNLTQPALSRSLKELEEALGFLIFARTPSGLVATKEGAVVIKGASLLLEELDHIRIEALQANDTESVIKIGALPFISESYLPDVLAALTKGDPPVRVELREGGVMSLLKSLEQGQLDAILSGDPDVHQSLKGFKYESLFRAEFVVLAKADNALTRRRAVRWSELAAERWILPARGAIMRRTVDDWFMRNGVLPPKPILESETPSANIRMAAAGIGLTMVPVAAFDTDAERKGVGIVRATPKAPHFDVGMIFRTGNNPRVEMLRRVCGIPR
jgi:LysR family transcriptional regulator of abg operon